MRVLWAFHGVGRVSCGPEPGSPATPSRCEAVTGFALMRQSGCADSVDSLLGERLSSLLGPVSSLRAVVRAAGR
jgi:hypothetical protein